MATKYLLDDIFLESLTQNEPLPRAADAAAALPDLCRIWPQIRSFLEWAKTQTQSPIWKPIVNFVIDSLITLGNRTCAGVK